MEGGRERPESEREETEVGEVMRQTMIVLRLDKYTTEVVLRRETDVTLERNLPDTRTRIYGDGRFQGKWKICQ